MVVCGRLETLNAASYDEPKSNKHELMVQLGKILVKHAAKSATWEK